ncbi:PorT family protein [Halosquirtibacter laminarini]|uniref:PorT family protein n=1 Tax=Halosquirtibacter laminarini TaxID=3374600 RepID=A0AC61NIG3_9BACT|nr:PorT family protein [Prolixibacteraceae bacterium]
MKKLILLSLILFVSFGAKAQLLPFDLGLKVGWNTSDINTSDLSDAISASDPTNSSGFAVGAFARIHMKKRYFIQPEVYFNKRKGTTTYSLEDGSSVDYDLKMKTIDVPILFGYKVLNAKVLKLNAFTGPVMIFNTNSSSDFESSLGSISEPSGTDWGYQLGLGVDFLMFTLDARYEWGLSNVDSGSIENISFDQKSNMLTVSLGWRIL